jgi:small subunit ribosomal protein S2
MVTNFSIKQLMKKKVHIGHASNEWVSQLSIILFNIRNEIHFIDLQQTIFLFRRALLFLNCIENHNYKILFLEKERNKLIKKDIRKTKNILHECALQYDHFYLANKIRGGILNNLKSSKNTHKNIIPNIFFISNLNYYKSIILESSKLNFIIIGLVDTNNNNFGLTYPIPTNDDNYYSINFFNTLIIKSIDNASLLFNSNILVQYRSKIIKNYFTVFKFKSCSLKK